MRGETEGGEWTQLVQGQQKLAVEVPHAHLHTKVKVRCPQPFLHMQYGETSDDLTVSKFASYLIEANLA